VSTKQAKKVEVKKVKEKVEEGDEGGKYKWETQDRDGFNEAHEEGGGGRGEGEGGGEGEGKREGWGWQLGEM